MTNAELQRLQDYVDTMLTALGLDGWCVFVTKEPCDSGNAAHIVSTGHAFEAWLSVAGEGNNQGPLLGRGPEEIRQVIAHELIHLSHLQADDMVITDLAESGFLPPATMKLFEATYRRLREHGVQQLARGVAEYLPMPPRAPEEASRASRKNASRRPAKTQSRRSRP
jgi:hypothetical protein